eukprot:6455773-Amphidinium_carterae.1
MKVLTITQKSKSSCVFDTRTDGNTLKKDCNVEGCGCAIIARIAMLGMRPSWLEGGYVLQQVALQPLSVSGSGLQALPLPSA